MRNWRSSSIGVGSRCASWRAITMTPPRREKGDDPRLAADPGVVPAPSESSVRGDAAVYWAWTQAPSLISYMVRSSCERPLWSSGEHGERAADTDPARRLLELVAQRLGGDVAVDAADRLGDQVERVVGVTGERARRRAELLRETVDEAGGHVVAFGAFAVRLGQEDLAGGEPEAVGGVAGALDELDAGVAVAAVDRHVDAEVLDRLDDRRGLGTGGPDEDRVGARLLHVLELGAEVGVARVEGLVGDDLDAGLGGRGRDDRLAVGAEAAAVADAGRSSRCPAASCSRA